MRGAHLPEIVLGNKVVIGLAYAQDRFARPYQFRRAIRVLRHHTGNPNTGLSFAFVLIFGLRMIPLLFVSAFMADLINRQIGVPWAVEAIWVALIGGGYSTALAYLKRSRTPFDPALPSMRDLVLLILVTAASAAFVASTYVGVAIAAGLLSIKDFAPATLRYWIGDAVGILALTPLALLMRCSGQSPFEPSKPCGTSLSRRFSDHRDYAQSLLRRPGSVCGKRPYDSRAHRRLRAY